MSIIQIGKAIHSILTSSAQVRSYLGSKIYPIVAEEKTTFPFMVYRRDSIAEQFSKDSKYQETASFEVVIVEPDYNKAATIADVVKETLTAFKGRSSGFNVQKIKATSGSESYYSGAYIQNIKFQITIICQ